MGNTPSAQVKAEVKTIPQVIPPETLNPPLETSNIKNELTKIDPTELVLGEHRDAHGSFSEIYFSEYKTYPVAVKKLVDYKRKSNGKVYTFDPTIESNFLHLAQHDYVVKFYGYVQSPQYKALVMEKCTKGTLYDFLISTLLTSTIPARGRYFFQIAQALAYLHDVCNIIHCDIKPENILLTDVDGTDVVKLSDFGFSILLKKGETEYTSTSVAGSPHYCAPERLVPVNATAITTFASDVFAFGIIAKLLVETDMSEAVPNIEKISDVIKFNQSGGHEYIFRPDPTYTTASMHTIITSMLYTNPNKRIPARDIVSAMQSGTTVFDAAKIPL